jgi:hypothetical protein
MLSGGSLLACALAKAKTPGNHVVLDSKGSPPSSPYQVISLPPIPSLTFFNITLNTSNQSRDLFAEEGVVGAVEVDPRDTGLVFSWPCSLLRQALRYKLTGVKKPRLWSSEELSAVAILLKIATGVCTFLFICTSI